MPNRGKLLVVGFFALGLLLAAGALWYHYSKSRRALAYWGRAAARQIVQAPRVELFRLVEPPADAATEAATFDIENRTYNVADRRDVSTARGLIHLRTALVEDANFDFDAVPPAGQWDYLLRFSDSDAAAGVPAQVDIAVDSQQGLLRIVGDGHAAQPSAVATPIMRGLQTFLAEQFSAAEQDD